MTRRILSSFVVAALAAILPGVAGAADFHATPSSFASMFSQAQSGDTVYLASGGYGSWGGGGKAGVVPGGARRWAGGAKWGMVRGGAGGGASPTMSGGCFGPGVRNITIRGVTFTGA